MCTLKWQRHGLHSVITFINWPILTSHSTHRAQIDRKKTFFFCRHTFYRWCQTYSLLTPNIWSFWIKRWALSTKQVGWSTWKWLCPRWIIPIIIIIILIIAIITIIISMPQVHIAQGSAVYVREGSSMHLDCVVRREQDVLRLYCNEKCLWNSCDEIKRIN